MARPRIRTAALAAAVVVVGACSSSSVVDGSGATLADTLSGSQQLAAVIVRPASIAVTYQEGAGTRTVQLAPSTSTSTSTAHLPSAPASAFDATAISGAAKKLASSCKDPDQATEAYALSATAVSVTTTCGTTKTTQITTRALATTGSGWSAEDLTVLWADLALVVPSKAVDTILLDESSVTFWYDSGSPFGECARAMWKRSFDGTSAASCLPAASTTVPKIHTTALTPDRLASALAAVAKGLPTAGSRGANVTSSGDTITVSVTHGATQKSIDINP